MWYGAKKQPPYSCPMHSCCVVKQEKQHASLPQHKPLAPWPFSALGIQGRDGTQDIQFHKLLSFPPQLFLSHLPPTRRSSDSKVKMLVSWWRLMWSVAKFYIVWRCGWTRSHWSVCVSQVWTRRWEPQSEWVSTPEPKSTLFTRYELHRGRDSSARNQWLEQQMWRRFLTLGPCAAGLPGSGGWRRPHSSGHMGERVHDAAAGQWTCTTQTRHDRQTHRTPVSPSGAQRHKKHWFYRSQALH